MFGRTRPQVITAPHLNPMTRRLVVSVKSLVASTNNSLMVSVKSLVPSNKRLVAAILFIRFHPVMEKMRELTS